MDFFYLTDYCRSVTIVTKTKTTFFTRKIDQFHPKTGQFRHFFEVKNVVNFSNSSRQYSVKRANLRKIISKLYELFFRNFSSLKYDHLQILQMVHLKTAVTSKELFGGLSSGHSMRLFKRNFLRSERIDLASKLRSSDQ